MVQTIQETTECASQSSRWEKKNKKTDRNKSMEGWRANHYSQMFSRSGRWCSTAESTAWFMILNWAAAARYSDLLLQQEATLIFEGTRERRGSGGERISPHACWECFSLTFVQNSFCQELLPQDARGKQRSASHHHRPLVVGLLLTRVTRLDLMSCLYLGDVLVCFVAQRGVSYLCLSLSHFMKNDNMTTISLCCSDNNPRWVDMEQTLHVIGKPCAELKTDGLTFPISQKLLHVLLHYDPSHQRSHRGTFCSRREITGDNVAASRWAAPHWTEWWEMDDERCWEPAAAE